MQSQLILTLLERNIIKEETLLYGKTMAYSLGQQPSIVTSELLMEKYHNGIFYCRDKLGKKYKMKIEDVQEIDGMAPNRLAAVFDIDLPIGEKIKKKRGRKPKMKILIPFEKYRVK